MNKMQLKSKSTVYKLTTSNARALKSITQRKKCLS